MDNVNQFIDSLKEELHRASAFDSELPVLWDPADFLNLEGADVCNGRNGNYKSEVFSRFIRVPTSFLC